MVLKSLKRVFGKKGSCKCCCAPVKKKATKKKATKKKAVAKKKTTRKKKR